MTVGPMYSAVRQAAIMADDESRGIDFTFGQGKLVLAVATADVGQSHVELPIPYDGEPITRHHGPSVRGRFLQGARSRDGRLGRNRERRVGRTVHAPTTATATS